ncbi:response regulator [Spongiibacter taiwanensis]|uniref:response regulator transcription factor n=1 Tax=Spongiibacter taiwanensis TaxID=1748242 RepID=UPI002034B9D6|nr:response regulator [Spongiibacter taiwanensis]USA42384.1 response regulator [Spongiibacter taiwanensis]
MTQTLLLVDDDQDFVDVLARSLRRRNYDVLTANTLTEAQNLCQQQRIDGAVVDLKLAQESGLSLIPTLRQAFPKASILMLTGYSSIATAVDAIKLGADNYLQKPASTREILAALQHVPASPAPAATDIAPPSLDRLEWEHIQRVLQENGGNISATARALGMHRRTLQRKLQKRPAKS